MPRHDIIVVAASAGGVETLSRLAADLPDALAAAVFVVLHVSPSSPSVLPDILNRRGPLTAARAEDGEPIKNGRIYVAPPDHHLLVSPGTVRLGRGPREHGLRPAADTLFRSAAAAYGPRVVGVVLSGTLDDGAAGLVAIKARGGVAVVQDPDDALFSGMPRNALGQDHPDLVLPLAEIGSALVKLTKGAPDPEIEPSGFRQEEAAMAGDVGAELSWSVPALEVAPPLEPPSGSPSGYTWMADRARQQAHPHTAARFGARAVEAERRANEVRSVLRATDALGAVTDGSLSEADAGLPPVAGES